jgi:large subunit ribosomal protein L35
MPKKKTSKSTQKRFKITGGGKLKRRKAFASHILTGKTTKRKRTLRKSSLVHKSDEKKIKRLLGI